MLIILVAAVAHGDAVRWRRIFYCVHEYVKLALRMSRARQFNWACDNAEQRGELTSTMSILVRRYHDCNALGRTRFGQCFLKADGNCFLKQGSKGSTGRGVFRAFNTSS